MRRSALGALAAVGLLAGCAIRLGGPSPEDYNVVAARAAAEDVATTVARLRPGEPQLVLLAADRDSTWFVGVAEQLGLRLSGPGRTGGSGLALLTPMEALGDTSLVLNVEGGGRIHMQDALYEIDDDRHLDLMLVRIEPEARPREAVRTLLGYYATDVGGTSAVLLAIETGTAAAADSVALLLRSAFHGVPDCGRPRADSAAVSGALRLYYGPQARIACERGRQLSTEPPIVGARVTVGR